MRVLIAADGMDAQEFETQMIIAPAQYIPSVFHFAIDDLAVFCWRHRHKTGLGGFLGLLHGCYKTTPVR